MSSPDPLEERILKLMAEQARLAREVRQLRDKPFRDAKAIEAATQRHRACATKLAALLDAPLRKAFQKMRLKLEAGGVQYTEMVNDFFVKLMEGRVAGDTGFDSFFDLRRYVATVLLHQFRDCLRSEATRRRHLENGVAPEARQKQHYFEERYDTRYVDFLDEIETWELSDNDDRRLTGRALMMHYVAGVNWGHDCEGTRNQRRTPVAVSKDGNGGVSEERKMMRRPIGQPNRYPARS